MKTESHFLVMSLFLILAGNAFCQDGTPTQTSTSTNAVDEKPLRDPFWPLDFMPAGSEVAATTSPTQDVTSATADVPQPPATIKWPVLKLKGWITGPGGKYVAQIEGVGGIVESGRVVKRKIEGVEFSWQIGEITEKGVEIKPLEARPLPR